MISSSPPSPKRPSAPPLPHSLSAPGPPRISGSLPDWPEPFVVAVVAEQPVGVRATPEVVVAVVADQPVVAGVALDVVTGAVDPVRRTR